MDATRDMKGGCLCGAVQIRVSCQASRNVGACHCGMCQRWTGGVFMSFSAPADAVSVSGDIARYPSSDFAERAFCPRCGSHLWMRDTDQPDQDYDLMPGLFAEASSLSLGSEIYIDEAPRYAVFAGDHRRSSAAEYEARNHHVTEPHP